MPRRSIDDPDPSGQPLADATTDVLVESGTADSGGDGDSGEAAIAKLGLEARAELERLRARLGLLDDGDGDGDEEEEPAPPSVVGRYRLLERIGHGGMGVVYRAHDPELGRAVAIKLVQAAAFAAPDKLRARLLREAKVLAKLAHPNVVRVYDCGQHEGEVYLAMEHVQGTTLREWQTAEPRDAAAIVDAYVAAATGLAAAHDVGIVHRDFKPDNVLVADDGRILVGDFGLAVGGVDEAIVSTDDAEPEGPASMTKTGALLGTVLYMAPEQLRGDPATARSDQFALCVALWEALAGTRPFEGDDRAALLAAIEKGRPAGGERLSKQLRRALERGLAVHPGDRFPDLRSFAEAIRRRRGPSVPAVLAVVAASLGAGLLLYPVVFEPTPPAEECGLERAVIEVRDSEAWGGVQERLDEAGVGAGLERLELHLRRLEAQAQALCERNAGPGDEARRQHLRSWVESLGSLLATAEGRPLGGLLEDIEALEHARLTAPPPRALDERVVAARDQSKELERRGDLPAALAAAERAVALAGDRSLELVVAQQQRGRVLSLLGQYRDAIQAHRVAIAEAEASSYDDARLEALLLATNTVIMRLEQLERGRDALEDARGLLDRLDEPWPSARRAHYHQLRAALLKRQGQAGRALAEQWLSILQYTLLGRVSETGLAYVNLGTIYERRTLAPESEPDDLRQARASYEHALALLGPTRPSPSWAAAAYNLGHWLAVNGEEADWDRAEQLLEDVRDTQPDHRFDATQDLLIIGIQRGHAADLEPRVRAWLALLREQPPVSPSDAFDAWAIAGIAAASMADAATFERTLGEVEASAAEIVRTGAQPPAEVALRFVIFELNAAEMFAPVDRDRAQALARAARERLETLPSEDRPADLVETAEEILAG